MERENIIGAVENILFAAGDAVQLDALAEALEIPRGELEALLDQEMEQRKTGHGLVLKRFNDAVQLATRRDYAPVIQQLLGETTKEELTRAMLETLSIIAYRQPITRAEIEELRGVNTSYILHALEEKGLVTEAGRKDAIGRPILYATSEAFLRHFDLSSLADLPPMEMPKKEVDVSLKEAE